MARDGILDLSGNLGRQPADVDTITRSLPGESSDSFFASLLKKLAIHRHLNAIGVSFSNLLVNLITALHQVSMIITIL